LCQADLIYFEELHKHNLYDAVSQTFVVLLPVLSVGAVSDARRYESVVLLRPVITVDLMTAQFAPSYFIDSLFRANSYALIAALRVTTVSR
jgi:GMP synthase (glutamine-hydrolysing)